MTDMKLKPCPFCGSTNVDPEGWSGLNVDDHTPRKGPACDDCNASADSVDQWNTRPHEAELQNQLEVANVNRGLAEGRAKIAFEQGYIKGTVNGHKKAQKAIRIAIGLSS